MTEPSVYAEDVSKLKDADELKQACIGLKDTNRYFIFSQQVILITSNLQTASSIYGLNPTGFLLNS